MNKQTKHILALGDSYTIGTGVSPGESWPLQLAAALQLRGLPAARPEVIARNGWTTGALISAIAQAEPENHFDLVTLQIGVNNQFRGDPLESYLGEFTQLLHTAIGCAKGRANQVVVLSIPDWSVTPFAEGRPREQIAAEIECYNTANHRKTVDAGANYLDIMPVSRQMQNNLSLLAEDELHPSGAMYATWVQKLLPVAERILGGDALGTQP